MKKRQTQAYRIKQMEQAVTAMYLKILEIETKLNERTEPDSERPSEVG